jgi:NAD(P)-dependent dehydrogenase (short-subunit alcohol dehydrogenase family)
MNKTAIVTGASGNLGYAVTKNFLDKGLKVIATVSDEHKRIMDFESHPDFVKYALNVTDEEACRKCISQILKQNQTIDVAALLVGGFEMGNIHDTDGNSLKKMFTLNFESAYYLAKEIFNQMIQQPSGGHIFLVGARPALLPEAGKNMIAYALSKSLVFQLAEILNAEAKKNVVTSVIVPSTLDTPQNRSDMPNANFADWVKPEEVAEIMYFTISENAKSLREPIIKVYGNA